MARHARVLLRHRDRQGRGPRTIPGAGSGGPRAAHPRHLPRARRRPQHRGRDPTPRAGGEYRVARRPAARRSSAAASRARRPDGTTAAERFFGRTHPALFEELLLRVPLPPRPRRRRPRPPKLPYLMPVAA
ncbi:DUF6399 domain-containing protein [Thiocapsa sp.]|uniref:DUF6399 domain-containing protein n=1 Tax=Thiocapsa sp. TaxID=2024551 RepID=UPI0026045240|nr:DUF6399 domain-containing protein [Thiocapsa sp.]